MNQYEKHLVRKAIEDNILWYEAELIKLEELKSKLPDEIEDCKLNIEHYRNLRESILKP